MGFTAPGFGAIVCAMTLSRPKNRPKDRPKAPGPDDALDDAFSGYDEATGEVDLWFLPDDEEALAADQWGLGPGAQASLPLFDPAEWRAAEGALAADLAALCHDTGRLAERLAHLPGAAGRLAVQEAASLSWWVGDRIGPDRLALWLILREGAGAEDAPGLARAAWVARRLETTSPMTPDHAALLALFGSGDDEERLGQATAEELAEAATLFRDLRGLAPATLACLAFHLWRLLPDDPAELVGNRTPRAREMTAALLAARLGAGSGLGFLPLTLAGYGGLTASGSIERRLAAFYAAAHQAVLSALMTLERLRLWRARAETATADLSGRTPARLIGCLADWPTVTAPLAEKVTGASRAAVQRNLDLLTTRGLIREITGQGRFRVWAAKLA